MQGAVAPGGSSLVRGLHSHLSLHLVNHLLHPAQLGNTNTAHAGLIQRGSKSQASAHLSKGLLILSKQQHRSLWTLWSSCTLQHYKHPRVAHSETHCSLPANAFMLHVWIKGSHTIYNKTRSFHCVDNLNIIVRLSCDLHRSLYHYTVCIHDHFLSSVTQQWTRDGAIFIIQVLLKILYHSKITWLWVYG